MTRRRAALVLVALLVAALLAAAPFVAEWRSSSHTPPGDGAGAEDEPAPRSEEPDPERRRPRQRSTEADPYAEFRGYVAARRAAGKPTTLRELLGPDPPNAENAAVEIKAALDALLAELGEESTWPKVGPWGDVPIEEQTPEEIAELREFVKRFGPFVDRLTAALDRPRCRFPVPAGLGQSYDRTVRPKQIMHRVLSSSAFAGGDPTRRLETLRSMLRLAREDESVVNVAAMVNVAIAASAVRELRRGVEMGELDAAAARSRLDDLLQTDWIATAPWWLKLDLVGPMSLYQCWIDGELDADWIPDEPPPASELVAWFDLLDEASRLPSSPFPAYERELAALAVRAKALGKHAGSASAGVTGFIPRLARVDAASRLARIALAAAEYRAAHGDFPASLDELAPMFTDGVPLDPFTDAPFVYERTKTGVRIASQGRLAEEAPLDDASLREKRLLWELKR